MDSVKLEKDALKLVFTVNGGVRGQKCTTIFEKKTYHAFRGIPYAKPPINDLRFKPPQKPNNWTTPLDAFEFRDNNFQTFQGKHIGSEDCLYLNVFAPIITSPQTPLPVVVSIHGGSFTGGDGNIYGPDLLLNKDVVLVSFNYRVGVFGFLALGTPEYSGNMGLKDQVLALEWVQANIQNFGGDAKNVTIFGISAGGASVHYHLLSPVSRGLFKRAICSSGCAFNPWSLKKGDQNHIALLNGIAFNCGYPIRNLDDLIEFVCTVDGKLLSSITKVREFTGGFGRKASGLLWLPVVEPYNAIEPFLTQTPTEILADNYRSDVDILFGYTSAEMMMYTEEILNPELLISFDRQFEIELPLRELSIANYTSKEYKEMAREIRKYYFGTLAVCKDTSVQYIELLSDVFFVLGIDRAVKIHAEKTSGKSFYYIFNAESELNLEKKLTGLDKIGVPGATHTDDACYIYPKLTRSLQPDIAYTQCQDGSVERNIIENVTSLYMNFAKFGHPTPDSEPVSVRAITKDEFNYFEFVSTGVVTGVNPNNKKMRFWNNLLEKYKNLPN